ncbi:MAG: trypsin-like peptidase domain-containing protein [Gammaproteobacteria bacterium]|nr:trypsin-like peptidase domain-containing protein [Gammaproteobacteria bacterium]
MTVAKQFLLLMTAAWLAAYGCFAAADLAVTIDKVRPAVVAVGTLNPTRSPKTVFSGSGFVVGNGHYVVTNLHVIPETIDFARKETIAVFTGRGRKAVARVAELIAKDTSHDLALLEIRGGKLPPLKLGNSSAVREGERYAFTGFPIGMVLGLYPVTHQGIISAITPIVVPSVSSRSLTAKQIRAMRDPYEVFQLDAVAYPGNSGSPLYDTDTGRVVGVVNSVFVKQTKEAVLSSPSGIAYAIPASYVRQLLEKAGVTP